MERKLYQTADGSFTIQLPKWDEQYHSKHGAIQEAKHVFIKSGLTFFTDKRPDLQLVSILEVGFGTGLNALLTALFSKACKTEIRYKGLEAFPVIESEWEQLNYPELIGGKSTVSIFRNMHKSDWGKWLDIGSYFTLKKEQIRFENFREKNTYDLIYFDAFGYRVQPELWTMDIFKNMYNALHKNGVLVTYSAKGSVRRNMQKIGFQVEKIPGPPGKREMLRGVKS